MKKYRLVIAIIGIAVSFALTPAPRAQDPAETPAAATAGKSEPPPTLAQFNAGKFIFGNHCARCHGWNMVNLGSYSFDLRKFPHNERKRFFHSVRFGKNAMPAWKDILTKVQIEDVWAYVRTGGKM